MSYSKDNITIYNKDGIETLKEIEDGTVDLILTDPPYVISKTSGMDALHKQIKANETNKVKFVKTEEDWEKYKTTLDKPTEEIAAGKGKGWSKENYLKYGHILGKKYATQTDYGNWDNDFTMEQLEEFIKQYHKKLRKGGTLIIWFDLWKITPLKELLEKYKFSKIRFVEWIKTNPQPINQYTSYLSNCREMALLAVKGSKPTFNSKYDKGVYEFPMASGKNKFHPTQKNINLFEALIEKHSNEGDTVVDTFLGSGTTAIACKNKKRKFIGCEINKEYFDKFVSILN